jgi:hypothetical protein
MFVTVAPKKLGIVNRGGGILAASREVSNNYAIDLLMELNDIEEAPKHKIVMNVRDSQVSMHLDF